MRYCPNCGISLPQHASHCPNCGAPIGRSAVHSSAADTPQQDALLSVSQNRKETAPPRKTLYKAAPDVCPDGGLSTSQYFWSLVLFAIPVIGWVFLFYWAFGRNIPAARKRLAKAYLLRGCVLLLSVTLLLATLVTIVIAMVHEVMYQNYMSEFPGHMPAPDPYYDYYGKFDPFFGESNPFEAPQDDSQDMPSFPSEHGPFPPFFQQQPAPQAPVPDNKPERPHHHTKNFF